ncbi:hypothetical protein [Formosa sp. PL04]|uniref:hypothetical protein n=1 Tax=Formosa sp. PL04 TaxID=3081755 RepID=UPI0029823404|nr:hypothetical protein [Formosa sp. PL04]MDW5290313.1 hypothetical protein [Formosa sp. PL04]
MKIEQNKNIRERWIGSLFELAHIEYQKRLWIDAEFENEISDYNECVCKYFDDLNLENGYAEYISDGIISKNDAEIVAEMHTEFRNYTERTEKRNLSDKKVLKDIEWKNFTKLALETWNKLKTETESIELRNLMLESEKDYVRKNAR